MPEKKFTWYKIANHVSDMDFGGCNVAVAEADGKKICIARFRDELFAIAFSCPHAGGSMEAGKIDASGNIVCPVHGYSYRLHNGYNTSGEGFHLKNWPLEVREDGIYVKMEEIRNPS